MTSGSKSNNDMIATKMTLLKFFIDKILDKDLEKGAIDVRNGSNIGTNLWTLAPYQN